MKSMFSALTIVATGSLIYLFKTYVSQSPELIDKQQLKQILLLLRKRIFSTLRQIAFIINNIKANEPLFQVKKISELIMKDGGSCDIKLNLIQSITIQSYNLTRQQYENSCNAYKQNDYQIRILINQLKTDIQNALKGNVQSYNGPTINISSQRVINIYRQILRRRMQNIQQKMINSTTTQQTLRKQFQIQQYLQMQGIKHQKQSNQKLFISILQKHYREDADFRIQFQNLEIQMQDFVQQIESQQIQKHRQSQQQIV